MPINFAQALEKNDDDSFDYNPLNKAISHLIGLIKEAGGHKFRQLMIKKDPYVKYYYCCNQDSSHEIVSRSTGKRDRFRKKMFDCRSHLTFEPQLSNRRLLVILRHNYHEPNINIELSQAALDFIHSCCSTKTPAEIYRDLQSSGIQGVDQIAQHQVYYKWQQGNASSWKLDADPFTSAKMDLETNNTCQYSIYHSGNVYGLAIYIQESINTLCNRSKELAIDATYGTNNSGNS